MMSQPLYISDIKVICGSMTSLIKKSFGPKGAKLMLTSSSGQAIVTKDGMSILSSVHYSHPVSKCILDSLGSFCEAYGDGCKAFIIYLYSLFEAIEHEHTFQDYWSLSNSLLEFLKHDFVNITEQLTGIVSSQNKLNIMEEEWLDQHSVFYLLKTYFCNSFSRNDVYNLSKLLANYVAKIGARRCSLSAVLQWFDNFVFFSKESYTSSQYEDGIFLKGAFPLKYPYNKTSNAILMQCPFEIDSKCYTREDTVMQLTEKIITYPAQVAALFLSMLKKHHVTLVLTIHKVSDYILQMASSMSINVVPCLEDTDLEFIMCATGKVGVSAMWDELEASCLVAVTSYQSVDISGQQYVKIVLDRPPLDFPRSTLFLCAPTDSLCKELKYNVKKGLKLISHCLPEICECNLRLNKVCLFHGDLKSCNNEEQQLTDTNQRVIKSCMNVEQHLEDIKLPLSFKLVAGGGYFDYLLIDCLTKYMNKNVQLSPKRLMWCRLVVKMLLALPQNLYENLSVCKPSLQKSNYLRTYSSVKEALDHNKIVGFCSSDSVSNPLKHGVWECLDQKLATVSQVLHLAGVLLGADAVIAAKTNH
ncbi:Bardet-Biedl syndrome 10 protein homolog isoform X2 [Biomphalaria glabrata]|nr:Bardet-Biedl syndrome 10 protein homolog isoform X2 [Biomphalaria glabrata]XP_055890669.1 Bardet-Biedl syndrome 10 protein homolog isoform X2 [Biomphalaria glabrata]